MILYLGDESGAFAGDGGQYGLVRGKEPADHVNEFFGKALHLANLVDNKQLGMGLLKVQDGDYGFLEGGDIYAILADSPGAFDVEVSEYATGAVEAGPAKALANVVVANFLGVETGRIYPRQTIHNFNDGSSFSAAGRASYQEFGWGRGHKRDYLCMSRIRNGRA